MAKTDAALKNLPVSAFIRDNYLVLFIFAAGLALRIYTIGSESIWYDEAVSVAVSKLGFVEHLRWITEVDDNNPPLYYTFLHLWVQVFGDSEASVRMPSAICGSLSVLVIYALGKLLFDKKTGLVAAAILAVSIFNIMFSQEARAYSLMAFLALLSFYFLVLMIMSGKRAYAAAYLASSVCLLYSHYYGIFVLLGQNIWFFTMLLFKRRAGALGLSKWLFLQVVVALLFLPCSYLLIRNTAAIQKGFWISEPGFRDIVGYFRLYAGTYFLLWLSLFFIFLSIVGPRLAKRVKISERFFSGEDYNPEEPRIPYGWRIYLLVAWIIAVVFVPLVISHISSPILIYRYTIASAPAFYILTARGICGLRMNIAIVFVVALIAGLSFPGLKRYYVETEKYDWREAMKYIQEEAGPGDLVLTYPSFEVEPAAYYMKRGDLGLEKFSQEFLSEDIKGNDIWLVVSSHRGLEKNVVKIKMASRFGFVSEKQYKGLHVYRFREKVL